MAYAPLEIMKQQKLIEKHYDGVEVEWSTLNSGSAINEGFISGDIDVGAMGVGPAVTGVTSGVPYKICSNMSAQPHKIMTNNPNIKSLKDITDEKIALVNVGSFQHILLAMAAKEQLGDAHALDENISAMSHPDGMTALLSGSVDCQLTTSPYVCLLYTSDPYPPAGRNGKPSENRGNLEMGQIPFRHRGRNHFGKRKDHAGDLCADGVFRSNFRTRQHPPDGHVRRAV